MTTPQEKTPLSERLRHLTHDDIAAENPSLEEIADEVAAMEQTVAQIKALPRVETLDPTGPKYVRADAIESILKEHGQ